MTCDSSWFYAHPEAEALEADLDERFIGAFRQCVVGNRRIGRGS